MVQTVDLFLSEVLPDGTLVYDTSSNALATRITRGVEHDASYLASVNDPDDRLRVCLAVAIYIGIAGVCAYCAYRGDISRRSTQRLL